ncbi:MerR family transcriptional regulator [Pelagovum pacificum]|uniref:MerR family transcriptional regulator n=1 Tax=Pelagovum pacificum TaxID=2588711 RepID=A0A5C5GG26_9RHOB|nr:MerR family transcriptional regulator [Pelagovum pacificum]QQA43932.1 MerR family transcriptional regulator [Pelagovum pacificum]TNY32939.1 MerR family transcriptional regulator [Pelagovum pacificum]
MKTISEVCETYGLTTRTLRHYEAKELLTSHRAKSGHRQYSPSQIARLEMILEGKRLGLTLDEIWKALQQNDGALVIRKRKLVALRAAALEELHGIERRLQDLCALLREEPAYGDRVVVQPSLLTAEQRGAA